MNFWENIFGTFSKNAYNLDETNAFSRRGKNYLLKSECDMIYILICICSFLNWNPISKSVDWNWNTDLMIPFLYLFHHSVWLFDKNRNVLKQSIDSGYYKCEKYCNAAPISFSPIELWAKIWQSKVNIMNTNRVVHIAECRNCKHGRR